MFHFRADPATVDILQAGKVSLVNLANNHALDFGATGLIDTIRHLKSAGIATVGAGENAAAAAAPAVVHAGNVGLGILGATDGMPEFAAGVDRPGTNVVEFESVDAARKALEPAVAALRLAGARVVIASLHWGPNMRATPRRRIQRFARRALALGVDIIHGHSAHIVHGIETIGGRLVLYDTGDFLTDYWKFPFRRNKWSFVFLVDVDEAGPRTVRLIPVVLRSNRLERAGGRKLFAICERMRAKSSAFGTMLRLEQDELVLPLIDRP